MPYSPDRLYPNKSEPSQQKPNGQKRQLEHKKNAPTAPIGLFDSGVGGLSIYQHLSNILPDENYLYFADTLNVPYGGREHKQIIELSLHAVEWLYQRGCKLIVIACNSASAHSLEVARTKYPDVPIVGLVPALKPAVYASQTKHVAVLATQATLNGRLLNDVIDHVAIPNATEVSKYFEPLLVPWVEAGMPTDCSTADTLRQTIQKFYHDGIDQIVLGCTHYPFFRPFIQNYIDNNGWQMQVVDSGQAIAMRVKQLLQLHGLTHHKNMVYQPNIESVTRTTSPPVTLPAQLTPIKLYTSKQDETIEQVLQHLLFSNIELVKS